MPEIPGSDPFYTHRFLAEQYPGRLYLDVEPEDVKARDFLKKAGITALVGVPKNMLFMPDLSSSDIVLAAGDDCPYLQAIQVIQTAETAGLLDEGSTQSAYEALYFATFDDSEWATYLPHD